MDELATFRKLNTRLQGHPATEEGLPGIRIASGSLGQGLSAAIGAAQVKKLNGESTWVFSLHGDGELQEGQIWEAAMYAPHHGVDNLISFVDCNGQQIDGSTDDVMNLGDLAGKWAAFNWHVLTCDGHDFDALRNAIAKAKANRGSGRPTVVLMKTEMGKGVDFMEGTHEWHGIAPNDAQLESAWNSCNQATQTTESIISMRAVDTLKRHVFTRLWCGLIVCLIFSSDCVYTSSATMLQWMRNQTHTSCLSLMHPTA